MASVLAESEEEEEGLVSGSIATAPRIRSTRKPLTKRIAIEVDVAASASGEALCVPVSDATRW